LRALGASRSSVVAQFLIEAAIIGLLAAVPGSVLGLFGARATVGALPAGVESRTSRTVLVATVIGVVSLGLGIAIATVGDAVLAGPAAALSVFGAVAVLYAGLGGATFLATTVARWFGAPGQLAADGLQRSPRQLWATMTTVVLGVAMTLAIGEVSANLRSSTPVSRSGISSLPKRSLDPGLPRCDR
jgi:putative ABC transport system permease protein